MTPELKGDYICSKKVFYTEEGTFEDIKSIIAFGKDEVLDDPKEVHKLLESSFKLFVPSYPVDMNWYGCRVIDNVQGRLFRHGLEKPSSFGEILDWLEKNVPDLSYYKLLYANEPTTFNEEHLAAVARHGQLWNASIQSARRQIVEKKTFPLCFLTGNIPEIGANAKTLLLEVIKDADLDKIFMKYLEENRIYKTVAVMGCIVNGPGEARHADIGIAGGRGKWVIFRKGETIREVKDEDAYEALIEEINR